MSLWESKVHVTAFVAGGGYVCITYVASGQAAATVAPERERQHRGITACAFADSKLSVPIFTLTVEWCTSARRCIICERSPFVRTLWFNMIQTFVGAHRGTVPATHSTLPSKHTTSKDIFHFSFKLTSLHILWLVAKTCRGSCNCHCQPDFGTEIRIVNSSPRHTSQRALQEPHSVTVTTTCKAPTAALRKTLVLQLGMYVCIL